jgi:hypothetical protein
VPRDAHGRGDRPKRQVAGHTGWQAGRQSRAPGVPVGEAAAQPAPQPAAADPDSWSDLGSPLPRSSGPLADGRGSGPRRGLQRLTPEPRRFVADRPSRAGS